MAGQRIRAMGRLRRCTACPWYPPRAAPRALHPLPRTDPMLWAKPNCIARIYGLANAAHAEYSDRLPGRSTAVPGAGGDSRDQGRERGIGRYFPPQEVGVHRWILYIKQPPERRLLLGSRSRVLLVDVTGEQHVQLPHPPPAAPAQLAELTTHEKRRQRSLPSSSPLKQRRQRSLPSSSPIKSGASAACRA